MKRTYDKKGCSLEISKFGLSKHSNVQAALKSAEDYLRTGHPAEAEAILLKTCNLHPDAIDAWLMLASICGQQGSFSATVKYCLRLLSLAPEHPTGHSLLGSAYTAQGDLDEGIKHLRRAAQLMPKSPAILNNLGNALCISGNLEDAATQFETALSISPGYAKAELGLGNCYLAQGRWNSALDSFRRAYSKMPENYDVNLGFGKALTNVGDLSEALECYKRASTLTKTPEVALSEISHVLEFQGHLDEALDYIDQALESNPENLGFHARRIQILYKLGDTERAYSETHAITDRSKFSPGILLAWGHFCDRYSECDELIPIAESMISDKETDIVNTISLHYLLGKLYDTKSKYEHAFSNYEQANTLLPSEKFNRFAHAGMVNSLISGYTKGSIDNLAHSSCADKRPVFIIGMPRSGTSLVEQTLACHPQIYGAGELEHIKSLAGELFAMRSGKFCDYLATIKKSQLDILANKYLQLIAKDSGSAQRVINKLPSNFLWLGFISQLFPEARVIHCKRDPRDCCLSIYFQDFSMGHPYAHDLGDIAFYYRQYEKLMNHWQSTLDLPIFNVEYEKLVENHEQHTQAMLDFLELPWNPAVLDFHRSGRTTATASWDQVRQPVYRQSRARWRNYQDHIGPLLDEFGDGERSQ